MTTTPIAPIPTPPGHRSWSGPRTALVVVGGLFALVSVVLLAIGGFCWWAQQQRDGDGYFTAGPERVSTGSSALSVPSLDIDGAGPDAVYTEDLLGKVRIDLESRNAGVPVFVGIGPADEVARYLADVGRDEVSDFDVDPFRLSVTPRPGGQPAGAPATQTFWVASATGTGPQSLTWDAAGGDWAVVVMNADGTPNVDVDLSVGGTLPAVRAIAIGALIGSVVLLTIATALIVPAFATRKPSPGPPR
jgi:hypothetical protein